MQVAELWRYPVKSLGGERLDRAEVDGRGLVGDRQWALVGPDGKIASGKSTRRFAKVPGLLHHAARLDGAEAVVTLADGRSAPASSATVRSLVADIAPPGWTLEREGDVPFHDAAAVHLVTDATLATLGITVERLRPNVLIAGADAGEPFPEDAWIGRTLRVGSVLLRVEERTERCVMVNHSRPSVPHRPRLLQEIGRANGACAGVYASVVTPGALAAGDEVWAAEIG